MSNLFYSQDRSAYSAAGKFVERSWKYINRSQTHGCGNWDWGRTIPFLGIHKWDFRCSVQSVLHHVRSLHSLQSFNLGENYQILGSSSRSKILSNVTPREERVPTTRPVMHPLLTMKRRSDYSICKLLHEELISSLQCTELSFSNGVALHRRSWVMHHVMVTSVDSRLPGINYDCKKIQILNAKNQVKAMFWLWFWPLDQLTYSLNCHKSCNLACARYKSKMFLCVDQLVGPL